MAILGLIDFEFVSLSPTDVALRNLPGPMAPAHGYENSFDDADFEESKLARGTEPIE